MKKTRFFSSILLIIVLVIGKELLRPPSVVAQNPDVVRGARIAVTTTATGEVHHIYIAREHAVQCLDKSLNHTLWTSPVSAGTVDVGPIVVGRTVVYVSNDMSTVKGLDVDTGSLKWSAEIQTAHVSGDSKTVFLATSTGMGVEAVDAETGKRVWKYEPGGPGSIYQLVFADGRIYTDSYVLNALTGRIITQNDSTARVITASAATLFQAASDGTIEAVRTGTSAMAWKVAYPKNIRPISLSANGKLLFFVGYNGMPFIANAGVLQAMYTTDGHAAWQQSLASSNGLQPDPIGSDRDSVYLLISAKDSSTQLSDIRATTGKRIWVDDLKGKLEGPPVIAGEILFVTEGPDVLYEINKSTGEVLLRDELPKY